MMDFPKEWIIGRSFMRGIDSVLDWIIVEWDPFFSAINIVVLQALGRLEDFLLWLPWWIIIVLTGALAWKTIGKGGALFSIAGMLAIAFLGLHDLAMMTLAIVLVATALCVGFGLPIGVMMAKNSRFETIMKPILDAMQTMPSFVYLIPAIMLFGLGKTPAVMSTAIYAIPPMIRLTNLGIRQVDPEVIEAAKSFGATSTQILRKVELPLSLPTIMAGVNQTTMMALAMVIIASFIGAKGLGVEILNGIARLEVGRGLLAGMGIVIIAIIIDRISQGLAKPPGVRPK